MIGCDWKAPTTKGKDYDPNPKKIKVYGFYWVSRDTAEKLALMKGIKGNHQAAQKGVEFGKEELGPGV